MKKKKKSLRMCIGCGDMYPKNDLIRVVKNKEGEISVDTKGKKPGRGAYICNNIDCFEKAKKSKKFEKVFSHPISDDIYKQLEEELMRSD